MFLKQFAFSFSSSAPAVKTHEWKKGRESIKNNKPRRKFHFKQIARYFTAAPHPNSPSLRNNPKGTQKQQLHEPQKVYWFGRDTQNAFPAFLPRERREFVSPQHGSDFSVMEIRLPPAHSDVKRPGGGEMH
jgi:hypothetical protein